LSSTALKKKGTFIHLSFIQVATLENHTEKKSNLQKNTFLFKREKQNRGVIKY